MTDVMKLTKKAFTWSVVMVTILWSMGLAALVPMVANAAEVDCLDLTVGDLVKFQGNSAVYILNADLERMYFPTAELYHTWYSDFSGVNVVPAACADVYEAPGPGSIAGINYRPGSMLVKTVLNPDVYVMESGNVRTKIASEEVAAALYGSNWATKVRDMADAWWSNSFKSDKVISTAVPHEGMVVKTADSNQTYLVKDGSLHPIDGDATAWAQVVSQSVLNTVPMSSTSVTKASIVADPTQLGGGTTPTQPAGTLSVALAANTPASTSVPQDGVRVPFTKVNLTAGTRAVTVDTLTVQRTGLSSHEDVDRVWAERNGLRVSSQQTVSSNDTATLTFSPALTISAGQTVTLDIVASLDNASGNGGFSVTGVTAGNATVNGSFPVNGNLMSFVNYTVATFDFATTSDKTVNVGDSGVELTTFELQPNKDVLFHSVTLRNNGTEDASQVLSGLHLEHNGEIVSQSVTFDGRYVTFNLKNNGLLIENGDAETFRVKADIVARERTTDPALSFVLYRAEDISVTEQSTGFGAKITETTFPVEMNDVDFVSGSVTVSKKSTSPVDTDVVKGSRNVVALVANVKADEAVIAEGLKLAAAGDFASFENVKVTLNGVSLGTETPAASMTFDSSFTLNKGDNELKVTVDVKSNATSSDDLKISVNNATFLSGMSPEYVQSGNAVTDIVGSPAGALITVQGAELSIARNDGYSDTRTIVRGATDNMLARFNVKALNDNVKITSVQVASTNPADAISASAVSNVKLVIDGAQVGPTRNYSSATFSSLNYALNKDVVKPLEIRADFDSTATGTVKFNVTVYFTDSLGKSFSEQATSALTTVTESGSVNVAVDAGSPESTILLAKSGVEYTVGSFKLSALKDKASFTELTFENGSEDNVDSRIASYKLYKGATLLGTENPFNGVTTFNLGADALNVAANTSDVVTLKAVLNPIVDRAHTGLELQAVLTGYEYRDSAGNTTVVTEAEHDAEPMVIRKTMPTFAAVSVGTVGAGSVEEEVLKFTVTADSNEDVVITELVFDATGTGAASTTGYQLFEGTTVRGAATSTPSWDGLNITVAKGTSKTFTVKANTSGVAKDAKVGVTLSRGNDNGNIAWQEVFIDGGNVTADAAYLKVLPITATKTY